FSRSSFFLYDTATIDIYTLSLHDALPIWTTMGDTAQQIIDLAEDAIATKGYSAFSFREIAALMGIKSASIHYHFPTKPHLGLAVDRKSTRLNSSHVKISYAVFCLKKKKRK